MCERHLPTSLSGSGSRAEPKCWYRPPDLRAALVPGNVSAVDWIKLDVAVAPRSLTWDGEGLVDWVGGGTRYSLDGAVTRAPINYAFDFDEATALPGSDWAIIYERLGTKALLLKAGNIVRELNRSFYQAQVYSYPACLLRAPDERVLVAHCPEEYNRLELEDASTGERLTASASRSPQDFFHSRLQPSPGGKWLLSAGWVWHPFDALVWFDVAAALADGNTLDRFIHQTTHSRHVGFVEESSASWQNETKLLISGGSDEEDPEEAAQFSGPRIPANGLAVYDIATDKFQASCSFGHPAGKTMPIGQTHVVTFFEHPRLYRINGGVLEHEWPEIQSGDETSSIRGYSSKPLPPTALDSNRRRFAVANSRTIHVVTVTDFA